MKQFSVVRGTLTNTCIQTRKHALAATCKPLVPTHSIRANIQCIFISFQFHIFSLAWTCLSLDIRIALIAAPFGNLPGCAAEESGDSPAGHS